MYILFFLKVLGESLLKGIFYLYLNKENTIFFCKSIYDMMATNL